MTRQEMQTAEKRKKKRIFTWTICGILLLVSVVLLVVGSYRQTVPQLLSRAQAAMEAQNGEKATKLYLQVVVKEQENVEALEGIVQAAKLTKKIDLCERALQKLMLLQPQEERYRRWLSRLYLETGRPEQADHIFQQGKSSADS